MSVPLQFPWRSDVLPVHWLRSFNVCGLENRCVHSFDADTHVYIHVMMLRLIVACITCNIEGHCSDKNWRESKVEEMQMCKRTFEILQMIVDRGDVEKKC